MRAAPFLLPHTTQCSNLLMLSWSSGQAGGAEERGCDHDSQPGRPHTLPTATIGTPSSSWSCPRGRQLSSCRRLRPCTTA